MTGTYTKVEIVAPSSAAAGETVPVTIRITNIWDYQFAVYVEGYFDSEWFIWSTDFWIYPGETYQVTGSFVMPNKGVTIAAYSYVEDGELGLPVGWHRDDEVTKGVSLAEVYAGTIIGIELEHNEGQEGLPVYNIPQGERGLVHVWGRNDMTTTQRLGIHWLVYDPDGILVEDYEDWSTLYYRQGTDHQFIGGRFNLAKPGTYTINIALSMNPSDPEIVDSYYGNLCTVAAAVPEPEFRGFGVREYQTV